MSDFLTLEEVEHALDLANMLKGTREAREAADRGENLSAGGRFSPKGWHSASDDELSSLKLNRNAHLEFPINEKTGKVTHYFSQVFFQDDNPDKYVIAYPGTDFTNSEDISQNIRNAVGGDPFFYQRDRLIASMAFNENPNGELTGFSLGGGGAADASKATGLKATTFNAMGAHPSHVVTPVNENPSNVTNYFLPAEAAHLPPEFGAPRIYGRQIQMPETGEEKLSSATANSLMNTENGFFRLIGIDMASQLLEKEHELDRVISGLENGIEETKFVREQIANSGAKVSERLAASGGIGLPPVCDGDLHLCPIPFHFATPIKVTGKSIFMVGRLAAFTGCVAGCGAVVEGMGHLKINGLRTVRLGDKSNHGGVCMTNGSTDHIRIALAKDL